MGASIPAGAEILRSRYDDYRVEAEREKELAVLRLQVAWQQKELDVIRGNEARVRIEELHERRGQLRDDSMRDIRKLNFILIKDVRDARRAAQAKLEEQHHVLTWCEWLEREAAAGDRHARATLSLVPKPNPPAVETAVEPPKHQRSWLGRMLWRS